RPLLWHRLGAFNQCMLWSVLRDPIADGEHIDSFLGTDAGDRNVDRVDEAGGGAVRVNGYDCQATANSGIDTENIVGHGVCSFLGAIPHKRRASSSRPRSTKRRNGNFPLISYLGRSDNFLPASR